MRIRGYTFAVCLFVSIVVTALGYVGVLTNRTYSVILAGSGYTWGLAAGLYLFLGAGDLDKRIGNFFITGLLLVAFYWGIVPNIFWDSGGTQPDSLAAWAVLLIAAGQSLVISLVVFYLFKSASKLVRNHGAKPH